MVSHCDSVDRQLETALKSVQSEVFDTPPVKVADSISLLTHLNAREQQEEKGGENIHIGIKKKMIFFQNSQILAIFFPHRQTDRQRNLLYHTDRDLLYYTDKSLSPILSH